MRASVDIEMLSSCVSMLVFCAARWCIYILNVSNEEACIGYPVGLAHQVDADGGPVQIA